MSRKTLVNKELAYSDDKFDKPNINKLLKFGELISISGCVNFLIDCLGLY